MLDTPKINVYPIPDINRLKRVPQINLFGAWVVSLSPSWLLRRGGDAMAEREELSLGQAKPLPPPPSRRHLAAATSSPRPEI